MLFDYIPKEIRSISIIGTSKNAGKTTAFNRLLQELHERKIAVGLASCGVDGEKFDALSGLPKPPILVQPGDMIATSRLAIDEADARFEILEKIKSSAIGHDVYLARSITGGQVRLTGTPSLSELKQVLALFHDYGCEAILVDGAYDRTATSSPFLTDGLILVVGASFSRSFHALIQKTQEMVFRFTLPEIETGHSAIQSFFGKSAIGWSESLHDSIEALTEPLAQSLARLPRQNGYLYLSGALTSTRLKEILSISPLPTIVIQDGSKLLADWDQIVSFYRKGGTIKVLKSIRLLGICINPISPDGYAFDGESMLAEVKKIAGDLPVFDVVRGRVV